MSKLINELEQDHQEILSILEDLQKAGIFSEESFKLLLLSKKKLLAHLDKEDKYLYPALKEKAKTDLSLRITLDTFGKDMAEITKFVFGFYEKYESEKIKRSEFMKDISTFIFSFRSRIVKEEVALYKSYEDLNID